MALRKLQYFFTKVMGPYHFFDGSGPTFFCSVNAPSVVKLSVGAVAKIFNCKLKLFIVLSKVNPKLKKVIYPVHDSVIQLSNNPCNPA